MKNFTIKVPASTANLGPGFDVLGCGLSLYLVLTVKSSEITKITYKTNDNVPIDPSENYICQIAQYIANAHKKVLPGFALDVENNIPLGRGLGSSGSAIVGGILMANELLSLNLTRQEVFDYACFIEGHPDNVSGSVFGHFTCSFLKVDIPPFDKNYMIDGADVKKPRDYIDGSLTSIRLLKANKSIKFVVCIPSYEVLTSDSRKVLPDKYTRNDVVFNIGRAATLVAALIDSNVDAEIISLCMQDRIHQQYRACLVPGLDVVLRQKPKDIQGLLGVCLSGAGPTVLALANNNFDKIGEHFVDIFSRHRDAVGKSVECIYQVLDIDYTGSIVTIN